MIDLNDLDQEDAPLEVKHPNGKVLKFRYRPRVYTSSYMTAMNGREVEDVLPELISSWELGWRPIVEVEVDGPDDPLGKKGKNPAGHPFEAWTDLGVFERAELNGKISPQLNEGGEAPTEERKKFRRLQSPTSEVAPINSEFIGKYLGLKIANLLLRTITMDQIPNAR